MVVSVSGILVSYILECRFLSVRIFTKMCARIVSAEILCPRIVAPMFIMMYMRVYTIEGYFYYG